MLENDYINKNFKITLQKGVFKKKEMNHYLILKNFGQKKQKNYYVINNGIIYLIGTHHLLSGLLVDY